MQIVDERKVLIEIREQQHGELEAALLHIEAGLLQITLPLLGLDLRLDRIGMRHFAATLELLADAEEVLRLGSGPLRIGILAL